MSVKCAFPNCEMPKQGNQDKCNAHRREFENALSDASDEDTIKIQAMTFEELAEMFKTRQLQGSGPPGRGKKRKKMFDWARFWVTCRTITYQDGAAKVKPIGHWSFKQRIGQKKNWSDEKADKVWWAMVRDKASYPFRDYEGDEVCDCEEPSCCGGKLRLKLKVDEYELVGRRVESETAMASGIKDKRGPTEAWIETLTDN